MKMPLTLHLSRNWISGPVIGLPGASVACTNSTVSGLFGSCLRF